MRDLNTKGVEVSSASTPDVATSRRHFMSAATLVGAVLAAVISSPTRALANDRGHGHGHGHGNGNGRGNGAGGVQCLLKGTQILTPQGERSVEDLRIGDLISTISGESKPIKWIGRTRIERNGQASWDDAVAPIRIARGAFNGDRPHSDLYVSYGHCFLINGLLISAGDLINGSSITRWQPTNMDVLEYLQIELESHDVILANGAPAETLPGDASHVEFDNFDEYVALYGAALTEQTPYYAPIIPIVGSGRREALRSHLRGVLAPIYDRRRPLEIIRDELARQAYRRSAA
jgi:Hint domain-containing protein